jgi:hypothetical protein
MILPIFGKELVIGETDKHGKKVVIGIIDSKTGKGGGIYTNPDPIFER